MASKQKQQEQPEQSEIRNATLDIVVLLNHPENYREHPPEQIAKIRASLREFGQPRSIVVQDNGDGSYTIVAGHGVTQAAKLEGWTEIRADVIPADWAPEKVKAYLVADNQLNKLAEDDNVQLASILEEARAYSEELLEAMGFDEDEFQALLESVGAGEANVQLREVEHRPPPTMAWVLVGIPVVRYGEIASHIEKVAEHPEAIVETTTSDE